jgi:hypothetical protein
VRRVPARRVHGAGRPSWSTARTRSRALPHGPRLDTRVEGPTEEAREKAAEVWARSFARQGILPLRALFTKMVTDLDHKTSLDVTFAGFDYAYDPQGNPLYEERPHLGGTGDCYLYDKAERLTSVLTGSADPSAECADSDWSDFSFQKQVGYCLDGVSNRTSVDTTPYQGQTATVNYTANSVNEYTQIDAGYRTHDNNGNLTSANATTMAYDYRNRLAEVKQGQTTIADYEYDVFGRRTQKYCEATRYYYDGNKAVQMYDGEGNLTRTFVFGQWRDGPQLMYALDYSDYNGNSNTSETLLLTVHTDVCGSARFVTGPDQEVAEKYDVGRFGETTIRAPDGTDLDGESAIHYPSPAFGWFLDEETGLAFSRAGAYDPPTGACIQPTSRGLGQIQCMACAPLPVDDGPSSNGQVPPGPDGAPVWDPRWLPPNGEGLSIYPHSPPWAQPLNGGPEDTRSVPVRGGHIDVFRWGTDVEISYSPDSKDCILAWRNYCSLTVYWMDSSGNDIQADDPTPWAADGGPVHCSGPSGGATVFRDAPGGDAAFPHGIGRDGDVAKGIMDFFFNLCKKDKAGPLGWSSLEMEVNFTTLLYCESDNKIVAEWRWGFSATITGNPPRDIHVDSAYGPGRLMN